MKGRAIYTADMNTFDWASIGKSLRQPLAKAIWLSLCLHMALLALVQVRPVSERQGEIVIDVRLAALPPKAAGAMQDSLPGQPVHQAQEAPADIPEPQAPERVDKGAATQAAEPGTVALNLPAVFDAHWYAIHDVDVPPKAVNVSEPIYPPAARRQELEGWVRLRLKIDEQGRVSDVEVAESQPEGVFDAAAVEAFRRARFEPARRQGVPVRFEGVFRVNFKLE